MGEHKKQALSLFLKSSKIYQVEHQINTEARRRRGARKEPGLLERRVVAFGMVGGISGVKALGVLPLRS